MKTITNAKAIEMVERGGDWLGKVTTGGKTYLYVRLGAEMVRTEVQG